MRDTKGPLPPSLFRADTPPGELLDDFVPLPDDQWQQRLQL